jgi:hypothetical protein
MEDCHGEASGSYTILNGSTSGGSECGAGKGRGVQCGPFASGIDSAKPASTFWPRELIRPDGGGYLPVIHRSRVRIWVVF